MEGNGTGKSPDQEWEEWLDHFHTVTGKTAVRGSKQARREFNGRRKDGRTLDDLKLATVGAHSDDWVRSRGFDVPETILRDSKIERYIQLGRRASQARNGLEELAAREAA